MRVNPKAPVLALTAGEPAGIGPELIVELAQQDRALPWRVFADPALLQSRAAQLGLDLVFSEAPTQAAGQLCVESIPLAVPAAAGQLDVRNAEATLRALAAATDACLSGSCAALVTAPMQKSIINNAGIAFSGHTEFLRDRAGVDAVVMLLVAGELRVALATTHLPLRAVADALTKPKLEQTLRILCEGLRTRLAVAEPRVLICGLNPHAGEQGHLGREEIEVIKPVCDALRNEGFQLSGPLPADTLFLPARLKGADAVLAMYHDQGLPVLKHAGFGEAVNVTLGLPFLRTSVDHGTALDLAGTGLADSGSLRAAIRLAESALAPS